VVTKLNKFLEKVNSPSKKVLGEFFIGIPADKSASTGLIIPLTIKSQRKSASIINKNPRQSALSASKKIKKENQRQS
jgi:hypothetical protein